MFLDLKKALETVDDNLFFETLFSYGVQGRIIAWF